MARKKKELIVNHHIVAELIWSNSTYNWIVAIGLDRISEGKTLGKNMEHFLKVIGVIEN